MKSRKEIAELANEYIAEFDAAYVPKNERIERIIAYGKKSLEERQIAPQTIMDKCVRAIYEVVLKQKITVGDEASAASQPHNPTIRLPSTSSPTLLPRLTSSTSAVSPRPNRHSSA